MHPFLEGTQTVEFIQVVVPKLTEVKGKGGGGTVKPSFFAHLHISPYDNPSDCNYYATHLFLNSKSKMATAEKNYGVLHAAPPPPKKYIYTPT